MPVMNGVSVEHLDSWSEFVDLVHEKVDFDQYIWRGQHSETWVLEPTFDRLVPDWAHTENEIDEIRTRHLEAFKMASRGRRGTNPPMPANDDEWWALGQHHGLATPLLDWSLSPFVAAFFAFEKELNQSQKNSEKKNGDFRRAIWSLSTLGVRNKSKKLVEENSTPLKDVLRVVIPKTDENPRLISQAGLFTISPPGYDVMDWIERNFAGDRLVRLRKVTLPNRERRTVLKALNRMNINHATLFPDLIGASKYCNIALEIEHYQNRVRVYGPKENED